MSLLVLQLPGDHAAAGAHRLLEVVGGHQVPHSGRHLRGQYINIYQETNTMLILNGHSNMVKLGCLSAKIMTDGLVGIDP